MTDTPKLQQAAEGGCPPAPCSGSSLRPYYEDALVTLYHGDAREILPELQEQPTILLTDPPYSSGGFQEAGKSSGSIGTRTTETIAMDNLSSRGYQRLMREVLRNCRSVDEAYIFTDWRMWLYTFDALEDGGWRVRNMLVWDKQQMGMGMPWRNQHELIAYAKRSPAKIMDGKRGNVLNIKRSGNKMHPTEKPLDLCLALLENSQPGIVIDPFAGSGTTLCAAKLLGRKAIGIEMDERHAEAAATRCSQGVLSLDCQNADVVAPPLLESEGVEVEKLKGGCPPTSCSMSSFSVPVNEDTEGQYAIHPVTGKRINRSEAKGQHTLVLLPLLGSEESECNQPISDPKESCESAPFQSVSPAIQ